MNGENPSESIIRERLSTLKGFLVFKPRLSLEIINREGRGFMPIALILIFITSLLNFIQGFNWGSVIGFFGSYINAFLHVGVVYLLGRWFFRGEGEFWSLFSSLVCIQIILVYFIPLSLLLLLAPIMLYLFLVVFAIYYIILSVLAVNICHRTKNWQSVIVVLISWVVLFLLNKGVSLLSGLPAKNIAGQAVGFML